MVFVFKIALCALMGYLMGNLQTSIFISNFVHNSDIRTHGSGNAGASNMLRVFGVKSGVATFLGDLLKAVIAVLLSWLIAYGKNRELLGCITAFTVVLGHNFPIFYNFKGGKGVACTLGVVLVLAPFPEALITVAVAAILIFTTRIISLSALISMLVFDLCIVFFRIKIPISPDALPIIILFSLLTLLMFVRHTGNVKRILTGKERRIAFKSDKTDKADDPDKVDDTDNKA